MSTENVQQDGGEKTQIYLPDDGRNFEDKTRRTTEHNLFTARQARAEEMNA